MKRFTVVFFIAALIVSAAFNYGLAQSERISGSVLRLHILAESDSDYDQSIKLEIRDKVLEKYGGILDGAGDTCDAEKVISSQLPQIKKDVDVWLEEMGATYRSNVYIAYSEFPTKHYGKISLPAGNYKALKIVLGEGNGQNWWCVMFPPVCFAEGGIKQISDKEYDKLKKELGKTAFEIVTGEGERVILKFKIVEIVNNIIG